MFGFSELNVPKQLALEMDLPWCSVAAVLKIYLQWQQFFFQLFSFVYFALQLYSWNFLLSQTRDSSVSDCPIEKQLESRKRKLEEL